MAARAERTPGSGERELFVRPMALGAGDLGRVERALVLRFRVARGARRGDEIARFRMRRVTTDAVSALRRRMIRLRRGVAGRARGRGRLLRLVRIVAARA